LATWPTQQPNRYSKWKPKTIQEEVEVSEDLEHSKDEDAIMLDDPAPVQVASKLSHRAPNPFITEILEMLER
jgi:hypothetical protein